MKKIGFSFCFFFFCANLIFSQQEFSQQGFSLQEPIKIEGNAQGTSYHITYFDKQTRDFQPEIEKILTDFDKSVSTYDPTSIISRINSNEKNVLNVVVLIIGVLVIGICFEFRASNFGFWQ